MVKSSFFSSNIHNKEEIITSNNYHFWFDTGSIDDWCVHCKKPNGKMWFAYDREYLSWIRKMAKFYGKDKVYNDFIKIYDTVHYNFNMNDAYNIIQKVSKNYNSNTEHYWTYFWMTMVAEERKENAILGKRIKRLAVYNLLYDDYKLSYVLNYMDSNKNPNMNWRILDEYCYERGF